jgi:hypothetical protein
VSFNGVPATFSVGSDAQVGARVPDGATSGAVTVTTPNGTATSAAGFAVVVPPPAVAAVVAPAVTGLSPSGGRVGTSVAISGAHLAGTTSVTFNGVAATFTVVSDTQLYAQVPASATSGPVAVTTPSGSVTSASGYNVAPGGGNGGGANR